MINKGLFTSNSEEWETPQELFDELDKEFHFDLDPCATKENAKCFFFFTKEINGLKQDWASSPLEKINIFMNPPYKSCPEWIKKAFLESQKGITIVVLIPARTDTKYFHRYIYPYGGTFNCNKNIVWASGL